MAGGTNGGSDDEIISAINVTPLVDIFLVLLIIFMVTAKIIVNNSIPTDLPKGTTGSEQQVVFTVAIDKEGTVLADRVPMTSDDMLRDAAKVALAKNKELRTIIQASSAVSYGVVIHVLDQLRAIGMTRIGFAIDKITTAQGSLTAPHAP
jgi:biopolymer transport protein ExbD